MEDEVGYKYVSEVSGYRATIAGVVENLNSKTYQDRYDEYMFVLVDAVRNSDNDWEFESAQAIEFSTDMLTEEDRIYVDTTGEVYYIIRGLEEATKGEYLAQEQTTVRAENEDALGVNVSDLQENIEIGKNGVVTGTLKKQDSYTGFSNNGDEQKGYFVSFHFDAPAGSTVEIKGQNTKTVTIPEEDNTGLNLTLRIAGDDKQLLSSTGKVTVTITPKNGTATVIELDFTDIDFAE